MVHHIPLPAQNPHHVAQILAELDNQPIQYQLNTSNQFTATHPVIYILVSILLMCMGFEWVTAYPFNYPIIYNFDSFQIRYLSH